MGQAVTNLCSGCGMAYGYLVLGKDIPYQQGECDWCGRQTPTTDSANFGFPERLVNREELVTHDDR